MGFLYLQSNQEFSMALFFFITLGFWQVSSYSAHLIVPKQFKKRSLRIIYGIGLSIILAGLLLTIFMEPGYIYSFGPIILFASPTLAVYYLSILFLELSNLINQKRLLVDK